MPNTGELGNEARTALDFPINETAVSCYPSEIFINEVGNGFIVKIGCKTFVFETWQKAATAIGEYYKDPEKAEKKYLKKKG